MKKICIFLLMMSFVAMFTTACSAHNKKQNMIQSKRRFAQYAQYVDSQTNTPSNGRIDLSEGPKQNYDAKLGPQNLNFDVKIVDPY